MESKKKVESVTTEKQAHSYREQTSIYQGKDRVGGARQGEDFREGTMRYKPLCIK